MFGCGQLSMVTHECLFECLDESHIEWCSLTHAGIDGKQKPAPTKHVFFASHAQRLCPLHHLETTHT